MADCVHCLDLAGMHCILLADANVSFLQCQAFPPLLFSVPCGWALMQLCKGLFNAFADSVNRPDATGLCGTIWYLLSDQCYFPTPAASVLAPRDYFFCVACVGHAVMLQRQERPENACLTFWPNLSRYASKCLGVLLTVGLPSF